MKFAMEGPCQAPALFRKTPAEAGLGEDGGFQTRIARSGDVRLMPRVPLQVKRRLTSWKRSQTEPSEITTFSSSDLHHTEMSKIVSAEDTALWLCCASFDVIVPLHDV